MDLDSIPTVPAPPTSYLAVGLSADFHCRPNSINLIFDAFQEYQICFGFDVTLVD